MGLVRREVEEGVREALKTSYGYGDVVRTDFRCCDSSPNRTMKGELSNEDESQRA